MDCERLQAAVSARMDGERLSARLAAEVDRHLATCAACATFERTAWRLRERARFELAPAVPDLVEPIMAAVREAPGRRPGRLLQAVPGRRSATIPRRPRSPGRLAPVAAALVVGLVAGSLSMGGPWRQSRRATVASAEQVTEGVARAAALLTAYQARFSVTEHHFAPDLPVRELSMGVWFRAPDRFRLDVTDHTQYPARDRTPTDLRLVVNGSAWSSTAPSACPVGTCPPRTTVITNRVPFSGSTPTPTDLILPMNALADAHELQVVGRSAVLGRRAIRVRLTFEQAQPLFPFLSLGGSWRPFFPGDRVDLWLDATSWFPLRYEVFPAPGRERAQWALRFGLPPEPPGRPVFQVNALSVSEQPPPSSTFRIPTGRGTQDQGARTVPLSDLRKEAGFDPVVPEQVEGLDPYRAVLPAPADRSAAPETVISYSKGLNWLKVGETRGWTGDAPYGPVGLHAEEVRLPGGGVAYYEPATDEQGRRLSIHAEGIDLYLETTLPRDQLLRVAASLPVSGVPIPEAWRIRRSADGVTERLPLAAAVSRVRFPVMQPGPDGLPDGFALASSELVTVRHVGGLTLYFQATDSDLGVGPIRLHEEPSPELPPASSAAQSRVEVRGQVGRWTPDRHQLEWVEDGVYYSIDAPGLDLPGVLAVADSLVPVEGPATTTPSPLATPPDASTAPSASPPGGVLP
ncbi:MAG TPA: zf-HC2 domain-containing protein [Actinomycetota bacterium]